MTISLLFLESSHDYFAGQYGCVHVIWKKIFTVCLLSGKGKKKKKNLIKESNGPEVPK